MQVMNVIVSEDVMSVILIFDCPGFFLIVDRCIYIQ